MRASARNRRSTINRDVGDLVARTANNAGAIGCRSVRVFNRFVKLIYGFNLKSKVSYCLLYSPESFNNVPVPLWKPSTLGNATVTGFTSSDFTSSGLAGDGTAKRIQTGWIPNTYFSNTSGHLCAYCTATPTMVSQYYTNGVEQSSTQSFQFYKNSSNNTINSTVYSSNNTASLVGGSNNAGFILAQIAAGTNSITLEGSTNSIAGIGIRPTSEVWLHARNPDGLYDRHRYCFWSIGEGFTSAELPLYWFVVSDTQRWLNRAIN